MKRHRLALIVALVTWAGCGVQLYLIHRDHVAQREMADALRKLKDVEQRVKAETENLDRLLKLLPSKTPDRDSKL